MSTVFYCHIKALKIKSRGKKIHSQLLLQLFTQNCIFSSFSSVINEDPSEFDALIWAPEAVQA